MAIADFGYFSEKLVIVGIMWTLLEFKVHDIVVKNNSLDTSWVSVEIILKTVGATLLIFLLFILVITGFIKLNNGLILATIFLILLPSKIIGSSLLGLLRVSGNFGSIAVITSVEIIARLLYITILLFIKKKILVNDAIISLLIGSATTCVVQIIVFTKFFTIKIKDFLHFHKSLEYIRQEIKHIKINFVSSGSDLINKDLDQALIGFYVSHADLAVYRLSKSFASLVMRVADPIYLTLMPEIVRKNQNKVVLSWFYIKKISGLSFILLSAVSMVVYLFFIIYQKMFLTEQYRYALNIIPIMLLAFTISGSIMWVVAQSLAIRKEEIPLICGLTTTLAGVPLFLVFSKHFGIEGSAFCWAALFSSNFIITAIWVIRKSVSGEKNINCY